MNSKYDTWAVFAVNREIAKRQGYRLAQETDERGKKWWALTKHGSTFARFPYVENKTSDDAWVFVFEMYLPETTEDIDVALNLWKGVVGFSLRSGEKDWRAVYQNYKTNPSTVTYRHTLKAFAVAICWLKYQDALEAVGSS